MYSCSYFTDLCVELKKGRYVATDSARDIAFLNTLMVQNLVDVNLKELLRSLSSREAKLNVVTFGVNYDRTSLPEKP